MKDPPDVIVVGAGAAGVPPISTAGELAARMIAGAPTAVGPATDKALRAMSCSPR
jgi:hypothetical protein